MVFRKNKSAQAAIEFLMTYGWMLLVVLIVGALIFSFVDFGSLLPNKLELNNNLRGLATDSYASATLDGNNDNVFVAFTYSGSQRVNIAGGSGNITQTVGGICSSTSIENRDTSSGRVLVGSSTPFINGQTGVIRFSCPGLLSGDTLEGDISISVENLKTGLSVPSAGPIRLVIND